MSSPRTPLLFFVSILILIQIEESGGENCGGQIWNFTKCFLVSMTIPSKNDRDLDVNKRDRDHSKLISHIGSSVRCFEGKFTETNCMKGLFTTDDVDLGAWEHFRWKEGFKNKLACVRQTFHKVTAPEVEKCVNEKIPGWRYPSKPDEKLKFWFWDPYGDETPLHWDRLETPLSVDMWMNSLLEKTNKDQFKVIMKFKDIESTTKDEVFPLSRWWDPPKTVEDVVEWNDAFHQGWWGYGSSAGGITPPVYEHMQRLLATAGQTPAICPPPPKKDDVDSDEDEFDETTIEGCLMEHNQHPDQPGEILDCKAVASEIRKFNVEAKRYQFLCQQRNNCLQKMTPECQNDFKDLYHHMCSCYKSRVASPTGQKHWEDFNKELNKCLKEDEELTPSRQARLNAVIQKQFCERPMEPPCQMDAHGLLKIPKVTGRLRNVYPDDRTIVPGVQLGANLPIGK